MNEKEIAHHGSILANVCRYVIVIYFATRLFSSFNMLSIIIMVNFRYIRM
jgi:hypothetical protein